MANYGKKKVESDSIAGKVLLGLAAGILAKKVFYDNPAKKNSANKLQRIDAELAEVRHQISQNKSGLLGSLFNADEISILEKKEADLKRQRAELSNRGEE